jgi:hypothetical protein
MTLRDWAQTETPKPVIAVLERRVEQLVFADCETTEIVFTDFFLGTPIQMPDPVFSEKDGWLLEFPEGEQTLNLRLKPMFPSVQRLSTSPRFFEARIEHTNPAKSRNWREFSSRATLGILLEIFSGPLF